MDGTPSAPPAMGASMLALAGVVQNFTGDGKGPSIRDYCAMLEQVGKMGNWTDGQLLGMAKCRMTGAAYDFAWRDEKVKLAESFSEFKKLALAYFDTDPPSVRLTRFLEARQRPEEGVRAFASRLQALGYDTLSKDDAGGAERARYAREFLHEQMRSQFVSSLRDPVRRYVLSKNPATFEAAVEAAVHEERNESLTAREERVRVVAAEVQPENKEISQLIERLDRLEHLLSRQAEHELGATSAQELYRENQARGRRYRPEGRGVQCFACRGYGHIARYCPNAGDGINRDQKAWQAETKPKEVGQPASERTVSKNV